MPQAHTPTRTTPQKVSVAIVLDRSGSMESCRKDAVGAVNSYLRQLREDADIEGRVNLVIFDSESIDTIRDRVPARTCPELESSEYQPRGATPLLDAVGLGVGLLDRVSDKDERRILAVMTDGLENASKEYTRERLKALLERKQKEDGWLVLYLGADHDSWAQGEALGLGAGNVSNFGKGRMQLMMDGVYARSKRYAVAPSAAREAASGGFTAAERAAMRDDRNE